MIRDVEDINPSANVNKIDKNRVQVKYKTVSENGKKIPKKSQCIRCGTKNKHFASDCFALNLKCKICSKVGHIAINKLQLLLVYTHMLITLQS